MADYISMKQVPGGTVTAVDDRILYDYAINSGIIYGCEISYTGNNMIHINSGYGIIKGGLFEIEDHTEYVDYSESSTGTSGQIYIKFDAAAEDKIKIIKETTNSLHPMTQDENANYDNGVYEIQLCTFRATTTGLTNVQQTFVQATMPVDVLDSIEAIMANTASGKAAGALAIKELKNSFSSFKGEMVELAKITNKTVGIQHGIPVDISEYKIFVVNVSMNSEITFMNSFVFTKDMMQNNLIAGNVGQAVFSGSACVNVPWALENGVFYLSYTITQSGGWTFNSVRLYGIK